MLLLLTLTIYVIAPSSATLPSTYSRSSVPGKHEKWYDPNPNAYGCSTGEYSNIEWDMYYRVPYCPNNKIEVHDDFSLVAAEARNLHVQKDQRHGGGLVFTFTVSCMKCPASSYGSSTVSFTSGHLFRMVCDESVVGALKEYFSDLLYGDNDFSFNADGTFSLGTDVAGLYQRWMLGADNERMTWTTHHDVVCDGVCNLRYTLVTPTEQFGSASIGSVWWTSTNYYEDGEASCDIQRIR